MAHVQKITTSTGKTRYRARWEDPSGKERCKTFDLKRDAERHLAEMAADMLTGKYADPRSGRITVREYAVRWLAAQPIEESSRAQINTHFRKHIFPVFGDRSIGSVRTTEVQGWVTGLDRQHTRMSARSIVFTLTGMFRAALRDRVISLNPCDGLTVPERVMPDLTIPTPEQVHALYTAAPARFRAAVLLAAGAGLRQSETSGLTLDRLTFPPGTPLLGATRGPLPGIDVDRQLACVSPHPPYLKAPKSRSGVRQLPLGRTLADALTEHVAAFPPVEVTLPWGRPDGRPITVRLLFTNDDGQPLDRRSWSRWWADTLSGAKLAGIRFHDLRHYAVSSMIRFGATIKEVQHFAGHGSSRTTLDTYGHLWPDSAGRTLSATEAALDFSKIENLTDDSRTDLGS